MGIFDDNLQLFDTLRRLASPQNRSALKAGASSVPGIGPGIGRLIPGAQPRQQLNARGMGQSVGNSLSSLGALLSGGGQQQQSDPQMDLFQQLIQQLSSPVGMPQGPDPDEVMRRIQAALNPIYDQRRDEATARNEYGRGEVKNMYRALSNDYERLAPEQIAQAAAAQEEVEGLYGQLRSNLQGDYSRISKEQADEFKALGIEDALPSVMEDQNAGQMDALRAASENQAQQSQRYMDIGQMDSTYMREGSPNATLTGNEVQQDMLFELNQMLSQLEAERTSGIQTGFNEQYGQEQQMFMQQQQMAQQENARRQSMLFEMLAAQQKGGQEQELNPNTFMGSLDPGMQNRVGSAFTRLQRSPEVQMGKVADPRNPVPGSFVDLQPEWLLAQADEMLKRNEISQQDHQALLMYIQLYYGMGNG